MGRGGRHIRAVWSPTISHYAPSPQAGRLFWSPTKVPRASRGLSWALGEEGLGPRAACLEDCL